MLQQGGSAGEFFVGFFKLLVVVVAVVVFVDVLKVL